MPDHHIPAEVAETLRYYVYALRDPRNGIVFYVGKGIGDRVYSHQRDATKSVETERAKLRRIAEIRAAGLAIEHLFLRIGIPDETTAFMVEQTVIDGYAASGYPLLNLVRGHHAHELGLSTVEAAIAEQSSSPTPRIEAPVLMFKINHGWKKDMAPVQIYEQTRGHWTVGPTARLRARYALGVAFGIVRGAYVIESWFPSPLPGEEKRWGFTGSPAEELAHVVGTNVRDIHLDGGQNPYRKFLDGYSGLEVTFPSPN